MTDPHYFSASTLDDIMRFVMEGIGAHGEPIKPRKGPAKELVGVLLELTNPRARLSQTEIKGTPYSCLGELCWYLAPSKRLDFIYYYIPKYEESADGDEIFGGYGPRLFQWEGLTQLVTVIDILRNRPDSRQAVVQLFDGHDLIGDHRDVPCTCTLQFLNRADKLHMMVNMRSNDAYLGLPHDFFCFTMLQEILARSLSVGLGTYKHSVGSLHLYDKFDEGARQFLNEGWQPTDAPMPPMPEGDPWAAITSLLESEAAIRTTGKCDPHLVEQLDPYWADLVRLLQVFHFKKARDVSKIAELRKRISSPVYVPFVEKALDQLSRRKS